MRLLILGANGRTGSELIDLGLKRGHQLTAFVRSKAKISRQDDRLTVVEGSPKEVSSLAGAMEGHDAILSALGVKPREILRPITLLQDCAAVTVEAMKKAGVKRIALVSAATLFPGSGIAVSVVRWILSNQVADLVQTEKILQESNLDWTIARPPKLDQKPAEERYRAEGGRLPEGAWSMSFRAVATFMLDAVENRSFVREVVGLAA